MRRLAALALGSFTLAPATAGSTAPNGDESLVSVSGSTENICETLAGWLRQPNRRSPTPSLPTDRIPSTPKR
jgi:hypothetical protein